MNHHLRTALVLPALLLALTGCESLGITANITSFKSINGKTEVKQREARNWDEFASAMSEVGTDFSDVAKEVGHTTGELVKALVDAPPPGKVELGDLDPSLAKYQGNEKVDFIAASRAKGSGDYDFSYVQIGVASYDEFFKTAAEVYALAFQMQETARRVHLVTAALTGEEAGEGPVPDAMSRAKQVKPDGKNDDLLAYAGQLDALWQVLGSQGVQLVSKTAELISKGQALVVAAPTSITNPKTLLHIDLIIEGLEQSVSLIKDSAKIMGDFV